MTHYLEYRLGPTDDGKEVLFLMQKVLGFTTKKVRSVKHEEWGILLNGERVTVRLMGCRRILRMRDGRRTNGVIFI